MRKYKDSERSGNLSCKLNTTNQNPVYDWHSSEHSDPKTAYMHTRNTLISTSVEIAVWWYLTVCLCAFCVCICRSPASWAICYVRRLCSATCGQWAVIWLTATGTHSTPLSGSSLRTTVMQR